MPEVLERRTAVNTYIARANIDHYLGLLGQHDTTQQNRAAITKLLIAEEDRFAYDTEQLQFAETRVAKGRDRLRQTRNLRDSFDPESAERAKLDDLLALFETTQRLLEQFCHQLREKRNSNRL